MYAEITGIIITPTLGQPHQLLLTVALTSGTKTTYVIVPDLLSCFGKIS